MNVIDSAMAHAEQRSTQTWFVDELKRRSINPPTLRGIVDRWDQATQQERNDLAELVGGVSIISMIRNKG